MIRIKEIFLVLPLLGPLLNSDYLLKVHVQYSNNILFEQEVNLQQYGGKKKLCMRNAFVTDIY